MRSRESSPDISRRDSLYKTAPRPGVGGALSGKAVGIYDNGYAKPIRKENTVKKIARRSL